MQGNVNNYQFFSNEGPKATAPVAKSKQEAPVAELKAQAIVPIVESAAKLPVVESTKVEAPLPKVVEFEMPVLGQEAQVENVNKVSQVTFDNEASANATSLNKKKSKSKGLLGKVFLN